MTNRLLRRINRFTSNYNVLLNWKLNKVEGYEKSKNWKNRITTFPVIHYPYNFIFCAKFMFFTLFHIHYLKWTILNFFICLLWKQIFKDSKKLAPCNQETDIQQAYFHYFILGTLQFSSLFKSSICSRDRTFNDTQTDGKHFFF